MGLPMLFLGLAHAACPFAGSSGSCDAPDSLSLLQLRLEGAACPADAATQLPTCSDELEVRRHLADKFTNRSMAREGPQFVRMVFHDAIDHNNLAEGGEWILRAQGSIGEAGCAANLHAKKSQKASLDKCKAICG